MLFTSIAALSVATLASAATVKRSENIDTTILQYALTLEHLENAFYSEALAKYDAAAFTDAGFPSWVRKRVVQVGQHEAQHVAFLQGALGDTATAPCSYKFPYTDVAGFLGLSSAIENVGVTAYLGAANKITDPAYVTAAGSILTTEARHQAWMNSAVLKGSAWSGPEDTPLGFSQVYSIAAAFITSCPETNPTLPVTAFPAAAVTGAYKAGDSVHLDFTTTGQTEFLIIFSGLTVSSNFINVDHYVTLPANLQGIAYGVIATVSDPTELSDENTVAGPIILGFGLTSDEVSA